MCVLFFSFLFQMSTKSHCLSIVLVLRTKLFTILAKDSKEDFIQRGTIVRCRDLTVGERDWFQPRIQGKMGNYSPGTTCGQWMKNY